MLALALVACSSASSAAAQPLVFAAASLTSVFRAIAPNARFNFAGSDDLATQIQNGAPADVYASASLVYASRLYAKHLVNKPVVFATNRLVMIVPASNPGRIATLADLERHGVRVVVGSATVPIGSYTRLFLAAAHAQGVLRNVVSDENDVTGVVAKVASGDADAGFVYATDATAAATQVRAIELPATAQPRVEYVIAVVAGVKHREAAITFVDAVTGAKGRAALLAAGFGPP
jgi:molybdate transport system substrate-binding protein